MQKILKFNVKKENNLGVDILFNRQPTNSELEKLKNCLGNIFNSEANKESPKHFYIGLDNLMHIENCVLYVLTKLIQYGFENDLSIEFKSSKKELHYIIDKYCHRDYSSWHLQNLTENFNYRVHDYLLSKGFKNISKNIYEHEYAEKGFKHVKNILKKLNNNDYYTFQEKILMYA